MRFVRELGTGVIDGGGSGRAEEDTRKRWAVDGDGCWIDLRAGASSA